MAGSETSDPSSLSPPQQLQDRKSSSSPRDDVHPPMMAPARRTVVNMSRAEQGLGPPARSMSTTTRQLRWPGGISGCHRHICSDWPRPSLTRDPGGAAVFIAGFVQSGGELDLALKAFSPSKSGATGMPTTAHARLLGLDQSILGEQSRGPVANSA